MIGAEVMHMAESHPYFTTLVPSIDSTIAKYLALSRIQTGCQDSLIIVRRLHGSLPLYDELIVFH